MHRFITLLVVPVLALSLCLIESARGHCQVPCGIYDDHARVVSLKENAASIAKAMPEINAKLTQGTPQSFNQATRWVIEKDRSATAIQDIVSEYFLTQRVKSVTEDGPARDTYLSQLEAFHGILVAAMKCRSTTDPLAAKKLTEAIEQIEHWYH